MSDRWSQGRRAGTAWFGRYVRPTEGADRYGAVFDNDNWVVEMHSVHHEKAWYHSAEMVLLDQNEGGEHAGSL